MRFAATVISLTLAISAAVASPVAAPQATSTTTPTWPTAPAGGNGSPCPCGTAPNFVYSECLANPDGTRDVWNCYPGSNGCYWENLNEQCG